MTCLDVVHASVITDVLRDGLAVHSFSAALCAAVIWMLSEDELTNVRYSESDSSTRVPIPGPSGTRVTGPPAAPMKNKAKEVRKKKKRSLR